MTRTSERVLAGRYRLEQVIGRGGMSTVYRATDEVLGRTVAVKVLLAALADQDATYAERFAREAQAAAGLASPSVVTVYDTGLDAQGERYIVMEYVAGQSLAELLADGHPLEIAEALRIAERVADALGAAHAAGILHRDIKPANVMVADERTVKVLDFGIARRADATTLTGASSVVGTAAYMAPERALGKPGDARSDVYSLGCLIYAMLTGRPPFTGELAAVLLNQQMNVTASPPSALRRGVSPALDALVLGMLAKEPAARPQTAEQVRDRLRGLSDPAARGATAATVPLPGLAPTLPLTRRGVPAVGWLSEHRRRAAVMAVLTATVALVAVALLSGGGGAHPTAAKRPATHGTASTRAGTLTTHRVTTATPATAVAGKPTAPAGPPSHAPGRAGAEPPGHGGEPPGLGGPPPGHGGPAPGHRHGHGGPGGH